MLQYYAAHNQTIPVQPSWIPFQVLWTDLHVSHLAAFCLPNSCDKNDIFEIFKTIFIGTDLRLGPKVNCKKMLNTERLISWEMYM